MHRLIFIYAYLNVHCALGSAVLPRQAARYNPLFSLAGVIALGVVVSTVLPSLRVAIQANRYKSHAQTVDINEFLPDDLKTAPAVWKVTDKKFGNSVYLMGCDIGDYLAIHKSLVQKQQSTMLFYKGFD